MCDCQSNFINQHKTAIAYSNFSDNELRAQCAQENGLNVNDPSMQYILDSCVAQKRSQTGSVNEKGEKVVGWIQTGGNILTNLGNVLGGIFNPQTPPVGGANPYPQAEPMKPWKIIAIVAGAGLAIFLGYKAYKSSQK